MKVEIGGTTFMKGCQYMCRMLSRVKRRVLSEMLKWSLSQVVRLSIEPDARCVCMLAADSETE